MSASADTTANSSLAEALVAREKKVVALAEYAEAYLRYLRDARTASWSWERIGAGLGIDPSAARRYWEGHRHEAGRIGTGTPRKPFEPGG